MVSRSGRRRRSLGVVAVLASMMLVASAGAALADYPPSSSSDDGPSSSPDEVESEVSNENPEPGDSVTKTLSGLPPWTDVHIVVELNPVLFDDTVRTNGAGQARFSFTIPADAPPGFAVNIAASGPGIDGVFTTTIQGAGDPAATPLAATIADTGADVGLLVLVGLVIAGLGVAVLMFGRRREHARAVTGSDVRVRA